MQTENNLFYKKMPGQYTSLGSMLRKEELFKVVPSEWQVIITDIKGSTKAILDGKHELVNLVATGSIVIVLNIAFRLDVSIPFFFGGDGATFILPPIMKEEVLLALNQYRQNTLINLNLELRLGAVPVKDIYSKGHVLKLAKLANPTSFTIPILIGDGLNYAEKLIKGPDSLICPNNQSQHKIDLSGMQCRWDKISAPANKDEIVTLLVVACDTTCPPTALAKVLDKIDEIFGATEKRQPISISKLKLKTTFNRYESKVKGRSPKNKTWLILKTGLLKLTSDVYFRTPQGKRFLKTLVQTSDTLVVDGKINTVISGNKGQRLLLQQALIQLEQSGEIIYGLHISNASIMSCYVREKDDLHIHFVDGSEGGYTNAAIMLKSKIRKSNC